MSSTSSGCRFSFKLSLYATFCVGRSSSNTSIASSGVRTSPPLTVCYIEETNYAVVELCNSTVETSNTTVGGGLGGLRKVL